jgi:hypothetical protein
LKPWAMSHLAVSRLAQAGLIDKLFERFGAS